jgi:hypothetical protein
MIAKLAVIALNLINILLSPRLALCGLLDALQGNGVLRPLSIVEAIVVSV